MPSGRFIVQVALIALVTNVALEHYRAKGGAAAMPRRQA